MVCDGREAVTWISTEARSRALCAAAGRPFHARRTRAKECTTTTVIVSGIVAGTSDHPLTEQYRALLERIARYPVTDPAARAAILAEIERTYRAALEAELAERQAGGKPTD